MTRSPFVTLAAGLVVGAVLGALGGYFAGNAAGRQEGGDKARAVFAAEPMESFPTQKPCGVRKGMTKAQATATLKAEGFAPVPDAPEKNQGRWVKRWRDGFHYANARFTGDEVADISNVWIDS